MALLEIKNISVRFGGLRALADFNFSIDRDELVGLIGPNGAGKTTAFNIVTGVYAPTSGAIILNGRQIHGQTPTQINHAGVARTFQNIRLFGDMDSLRHGVVAAPEAVVEGDTARRVCAFAARSHAPFASGDSASHARPGRPRA